MNICFLNGRIVSKIEFNFIFNNKAKISKVEFWLCALDKNNYIEKIKMKAYNSNADKIYSTFKQNDIITVQGIIEEDAVKIRKIEYL